jgi:hypothetical protein
MAPMDVIEVLRHGINREHCVAVVTMAAEDFACKYRNPPS